MKFNSKNETMKKLVYIIFIIFLGTSCVKNLKEDPKGVLDATAMFSNPVGITLVANALGTQLANIIYNSSAHSVPYMGGDDLTQQPSKQNAREVDIFAVTSANASLQTDWGGYFAAIRTANTIISNVQYSTADKSVNDDCLGQAYFYRAISYSFLTRIWGKVPLFLKYSDVIDYTIAPSEVADIYATIVSDCQKADSLLPESRPLSECFLGAKPIKGTAKALLSQVYLTMAGWPLKQTSNYALAAEKAKEVIDNASTYGYELADIHDLWTWAYNYKNKECIFGMFYYNTAEGDWSGTMASPPADRPEEEAGSGWAEYYADISFFNKFPAGPRKDVTYKTSLNLHGTVVPWYSDLTRHQHPYFHKYTDDRDSLDWWGSRTQQIIRYAEVLLTYAEAKAMSTGVDQSAYDAVNLVRARAAGKPNDLTPGLSASAFRDSVVAERGWEFAGGEPASRWFDLIRLERVEEANASRDPKEIPLNHAPTHADYWMPIPSYDKAINPNLK